MLSVATGTGDAANPQIIVNDQGDAYVIWSEDTGGQTDAFYWSSASGTTLNISSSTGDTLTFEQAKIELDPNGGEAHVLWGEVDNTGADASAYYFDGSVTTELNAAVNTSLQFRAVDIFFDQNDDVHLAWGERAQTCGSQSRTQPYYYNPSSMSGPERLTAFSGCQDLATNELFLDSGAVFLKSQGVAGGSMQMYLWTDPENNTLHSDFGPRSQAIYEGSAVELVYELITDSSGNNYILWVEREDSYLHGTTNAPASKSDITYSEINLYNLTTGTNIEVSPEDMLVNGGYYSVDVIIDSNDVIHISFVESSHVTGQSAVHYWNSQTQATVQISQEELGTGRTNINLDANNIPYILFEQSNATTGGQDMLLWNARTGLELVSYTTGDTNFEANRYDREGETLISLSGGNMDPFSAIHESVSGSSVNVVVNRYSEAIYEPTFLAQGALQNWKFIAVEQDVPENTEIFYTVGKVSGGSCDITAYPNLVDVTTANGIIEIKNDVPASDTEICLHTKMVSEDGDATPAIRAITAVYVSDEKPSFEFDVCIVDEEVFDAEVENIVNISTSTPEPEDDEPNTDDDILYVQIADLAIEKTVDQASITENDIDAGSATILWTLDYINNGPDQSENVVITDTLPGAVGTEFAVSPVITITGDGTHTDFVCSILGDNVTIECKTDLLPSGATGTIQIEATFLGDAFDAGDTFANVVTIESETADTDDTNNDDVAPTTVGSFANVAIVKSTTYEAPLTTSCVSALGTFPLDTTAAGCEVLPSTNVGDTITYLLNYTNNGNADATNVVITDNLDPQAADLAELDPSGVAFDYTYASHFASDGCSVSGTVVTCGAGNVTLTNGDAGTIIMTVPVTDNTDLLTVASPDSNDVVENYVSISTDTSETSISDNEDEIETPIVQAGLSSLSGYVYVDENEDDSFNGISAGTPTEMPISGVTMILVGTDIFGNTVLPDPSDPYYNVALEYLGLTGNPGQTTVVPPTTTDSSGFYIFGNLNPGEYSVIEVQPTGYTSVEEQPGTNLPIGNNGNVPTDFVDVTGEEYESITSITLDEDDNSILNNFGEIQGMIGNQLWIDVVDDNIYDPATDLPLVGVGITLYYDSDGDGSIDETDPADKLAVATTDANGNYLFEGLDVNDILYRVVVTDDSGEIPLQGLAFTGDQANTTDDHSKDETGYDITLTPISKANLTADFGYIYDGSIGNQVWHDVNEDGVFDAGENPIEGVVIELFEDTDGDGVYETSHGTQTTDANGNYLFEGLNPDSDYQVIPQTPSGYDVTPGTSVTTPGVDGEHQDESGYEITLTPTDKDNTTADFGYIYDGQVGNQTWIDVNENGVFDAGEPVFPGVEITLYVDDGTDPNQLDGGDTQVGVPVVTDVNGNYLFDELDPTRTYIAVVTNIPSGYTVTNSGTPGANDNHQDETGYVMPLSLENPVNLTGDFGFYYDGSIGNQIWEDANEDGVFDSTETGIEGVVVDLYIDTDGDGVGDAQIGTTTTDTNGQYLFENLDPTQTYVVVPTGPSGYDVTPGTSVTTPGVDGEHQDETGYAITLTPTEPDNFTGDFGYVRVEDGRTSTRRPSEDPDPSDSPTDTPVIPPVESPVESPEIPYEETSVSEIGFYDKPFKTIYGHCVCGYEVYLLQVLLNHNGFPVSESRAGSLGQETDCYGFKTYEAMKKFQAAYGVDPTGLMDGYTLNKLNELVVNGTLSFPNGVDPQTLKFHNVTPYTGPFFDPLLDERFWENPEAYIAELEAGQVAMTSMEVPPQEESFPPTSSDRDLFNSTSETSLTETIVETVSDMFSGETEIIEKDSVAIDVQVTDTIDDSVLSNNTDTFIQEVEEARVPWWKRFINWVTGR
ncbi:MAG: SdrD B-like domain-containing protein [Bacteroidota bacterium]